MSEEELRIVQQSVQEAKSVLRNYPGLSSDERVVMTLGIHIGISIGQKLEREKGRNL